MAATRRKKTSYRRRKTASRSRSGPRALPNWSLLVLGLAIGLLAAWLIQLIVTGVRTPGSGLNTLATSSSKPPPAPKPAAGKPAPAPKPTYDFYTILPETETPITERDWDSHRHTKPDSGIQYMLQAASYSSFADADRLKAKLTLSGLTPVIQKVTIDGKGTYYRVRIGPYRTADDADRARQQLTTLGIKPMMLKLASNKR